MSPETNVTKTPLDVVLTFLIHVLAVFGSMAMAHHFFPGSTIWMFFIVLLGVLLIDWNRHPEPKYSVIGLLTLALKRSQQVVKSVRPVKLIDNLPPENPKNG